MCLEKFLAEYDFILAEAAVIEALKRSGEIELHPELVNALLIYDDQGRRLIAGLINQFIGVAKRCEVPIMVTTPTWRANRERLERVGELRNVNADAVKFIRELQAGWGGFAEKVMVGGLMSCKNDCYLPEQGLSRSEAQVFHAWQSQRLAGAGVDFLIAQTLPALPEALGLAQALAATEIPYIISFVINREGLMLDGHSLAEAIATIDSLVEKVPVGYMVNCAYPSFLKVGQEPEVVVSRLLGFQANASSLDHDQLDEAESLKADTVADWGQRMVALNREFKIPILGGCCGTGVAHLEYLASHLAGIQHQPDETPLLLPTAHCPLLTNPVRPE